MIKMSLENKTENQRANKDSEEKKREEMKNEQRKKRINGLANTQNTRRMRDAHTVRVENVL